MDLPSTIIVEAAARVGVREIAPHLPNLYTKEDAERLAAAVQGIELTDRHGWLIPSVQNWR